MGSKRRLLPKLGQVFERLDPQTALDVFTGTTRVAQMLRAMGVAVTSSDISEYSRVFSRAWVSGRYNVKFVRRMAELFNESPGYRGWFTDNYCDVDGRRGGVVRYMMPTNGCRVDHIRDQIQYYLQADVVGMGYDEANALVAALIMGMDKVDNTVGIQQAYLKEWCARAKKQLKMCVLGAPVGPRGHHIMGDVLEVDLPSADVAYLDPPYTSHAYGSYYHIWETVAKWDKPQLDLKTNRRVDRCYGKATTPWNRKKEAPGAFRKLLGKLDVGRVVISYAGGSVVPLDDLTDIISETHMIENIDKVTVNENVMSKIGNGSRDCKTVPGRVEWIVEATPRS